MPGGGKLPDLEPWQVKQLALGLGFRKRVLAPGDACDTKPEAEGNRMAHAWQKWTRSGAAKGDGKERTPGMLKFPEK